MPTRPVSWDLDVPPANLLAPAKPAVPASQVPSLARLRRSLLGTRFELLKISTFAAFLLVSVGIAIHGSQLKSSHNQLAANAGAAFKGLLGTASNRAAALRNQAQELASRLTSHRTATHAISKSPAAIAQATMPPPTRSHRVRGQHPAAVASSKRTSLEAPAPRWNGKLPDLPDFALTEGNLAGRKILRMLNGSPQRRGKTETVMDQVRDRFDAQNPAGAASRNPSSMLGSLIAPGSMIAAIVALVLYIIFVIVLVRVKGGLRAVGGTHAL
jgi:hypothetical protein